MFVNHYEILGVEPDADLVKITAAWNRLLKKCQTDLNQTEKQVNEQTQRLNKAYEVLSDPAQRKRFDQQLDELLNGSRPESDSDKFDPRDETKPRGSKRKANSSHRSSGRSTRSAYSKYSKGKSGNHRNVAVVTLVGIGLGALTAIPLGLFLVWVISGFDPLGIFRQKATDKVVEIQDSQPGKSDSAEIADGDNRPLRGDSVDEAKKAKIANTFDRISISYAKFGESRQTIRVEGFVEDVANKKGVITTVTTEGLNTTNPVGRPRTLLRVTYQINDEITGTLVFPNGDQVDIRKAILEHAIEHGRPFEKIEITYALFGKRRNKVRCEEQVAAVASQIDTITAITTHGLSLRNPSGIVRHELDFNYTVAGKKGSITLKYGQKVDLRKTILEHAGIEDGSYVPSTSKSESEI